mgnify:FL=1
MKQNNGHLRNKPKDMSKSDGKRSYEYAGNKDEDFDEAWSKFKANTKKAFMGKYAKGGGVKKESENFRLTLNANLDVPNEVYKGIIYSDTFSTKGLYNKFNRVWFISEKQYKDLKDNKTITIEGKNQSWEWRFKVTRDMVKNIEKLTTTNQSLAFAKGGGLELVHVYDDDGSLFGTGSRLLERKPT